MSNGGRRPKIGRFRYAAPNIRAKADWFASCTSARHSSYRAPEQEKRISTNVMSTTTDLYGLGAILYDVSPVPPPLTTHDFKTRLTNGTGKEMSCLRQSQYFKDLSSDECDDLERFVDSCLN